MDVPVRIITNWKIGGQIFKSLNNSYIAVLEEVFQF